MNSSCSSTRMVIVTTEGNRGGLSKPVSFPDEAVHGSFANDIDPAGVSLIWRKGERAVINLQEASFSRAGEFSDFIRSLRPRQEQNISQTLVLGGSYQDE